MFYFLPFLLQNVLLQFDEDNVFPLADIHLNYIMYYYYNKILVKHLSVLFKLHNVLLLFTRTLWLGIMLPSFKLHNVLLLFIPVCCRLILAYFHIICQA